MHGKVPTVHLQGQGVGGAQAYGGLLLQILESVDPLRALRRSDEISRWQSEGQRTDNRYRNQNLARHEGNIE